MRCSLAGLTGGIEGGADDISHENPPPQWLARVLLAVRCRGYKLSKLVEECLVNFKNLLLANSELFCLEKFNEALSVDEFYG